MPERTRWIISQRMAGVKMDEIGTALGISESRVSQILFEIRPELERVLVGLTGSTVTADQLALRAFARCGRCCAAADGSLTSVGEVGSAVGSRLSSSLSSVR